jgi:hypothetical protein
VSCLAIAFRSVLLPLPLGPSCSRHLAGREHDGLALHDRFIRRRIADFELFADEFALQI